MNNLRDIYGEVISIEEDFSRVAIYNDFSMSENLGESHILTSDLESYGVKRA